MTPFYAAGLRFSCRSCSNCCRYESGFVFLTEDDLAALARVKAVAPAEFTSMYCRPVETSDGGRLSLRERNGVDAAGRPSNDCIFWKDGCTVYEARPAQCRTFPFWPEILASEAAWDENARSCPGANRGRLYRREEIEALLQGQSH